MRFPVVVTLAVTVACPSLLGCNLLGIRANPRLEKVVRETESSRATTKLDYNEDGRLVEVDDEFEILELDWNDGVLVQLTREDKDDGSKLKTDLEYENGKLVELTKDLSDDVDDVEEVTTIAYDKSGRIEKVERDFADGESVNTTIYERDKAGRIVAIVNKFVYDSGDGLERSESKTEIEYDDGRIVKLSQRDDYQDMTFDVEYEDGRLAGFHIESTFEGSDGVEESAEGDVVYEYDDDGLIVAAHAEADNESEVDFELEYGEGEAVDLDVTPTSSLFFLPFFDLRGAAFSNFDTRTQAPRLSGASW